MSDTCPGHRHCFALGGTKLCRVHGCRVCGACVLADTEEWPAPLCIAHAPEALLDYVAQCRRALLGLVEYFDGVHAVDCSLTRTGGPASDETINATKRAGVSSCSCGCFAVRQGTREHFHLETEPRSKKRDTDRAPRPAASTPAGLVRALESTLGGRFQLIEVDPSWGRKRKGGPN